MNDALMAQFNNLLAQKLADIKGEEIYVETSCMNIDERELIGLLRAMQTMDVSDKAKALCEKLIPFFSVVGKAKWFRGELTDLGLRVGNRYRGTISANDDLESLEEDESKP
jgi:hypothetical protein